MPECNQVCDELPVVGGLESEQHDETASSEQAPDEAVSSRQSDDAVRAALDTLPPEQREVVALAYIEGLSHSEIAARLDTPIGTVKSRMRIAYQKIRSALEGLQ